MGGQYFFYHLLYKDWEVQNLECRTEYAEYLLKKGVHYKTLFQYYFLFACVSVFAPHSQLKEILLAIHVAHFFLFTKNFTIG